MNATLSSTPLIVNLDPPNLFARYNEAESRFWRLFEVLDTPRRMQLTIEFCAKANIEAQENVLATWEARVM